MNAYEENMSKYFLIKEKMSYAEKIKMKTPLFEYKIKYTETTFERRTLTSLIWVKKDNETGGNYREII